MTSDTSEISRMIALRVTGARVDGEDQRAPDMGREFTDWVARLPSRDWGSPAAPDFPAAETPGWVPIGWHAHSRLDGEFVEMHLVRRDTGGWALVTQDTLSKRGARTMLHQTAATLIDLHRQVREEGPNMEPVAEWLGRTLAGLYDIADEAEAASRVIVALGGAATLEPLAALP